MTQKRPYPLVADHEPIMTPAPVMDLYDKEDLISQIRGPYVERFDGPSSAKQESGQVQQVAKQLVQSAPALPSKEASYLAEMRQKAKEDVKRKRQSMMAQELKLAPKSQFSSSLKMAEKPKEDKPLTALGKLAQVLYQTDYILAELPRIYQEPKNPSSKEKPKKNNYDFLKKSQIYQPNRQLQKERQVAQELNLTRFDD